MTDALLITAILLPAILLAVVLYWVDRTRRREAHYRWAARSGWKVVSYHQPRVTEASAFPFSASKAQKVFRVEVEGNDGTRRTGWVRLGSPWLGLSSDSFDVRWDNA